MPYRLRKPNLFARIIDFFDHGKEAEGSLQFFDNFRRKKRFNVHIIDNDAIQGAFSYIECVF